MCLTTLFRQWNIQSYLKNQFASSVWVLNLLCVADLCFLEGGQFSLLVRCYWLVFHVIILWGQNRPLILRASKSSTSSKLISFLFCEDEAAGVQLVS